MNIERLSKQFDGVVWADKKRYFGLPISFTTYILTETTLITRTGFFNLREDEIELYRIIDKSAFYPLSQRIFGCGTLKLTAKDSDTPIKELQSIKRPREVKQMLEKLIEAQRTQYDIRGRDMYGAAGLTSDSDIDF